MKKRVYRKLREEAEKIAESIKEKPSKTLKKTFLEDTQNKKYKVKKEEE